MPWVVWKKNTPKYSCCKNNQKAQSTYNFKPLQLLYMEQIRINSSPSLDLVFLLLFRGCFRGWWSPMVLEHSSPGGWLGRTRGAGRNPRRRKAWSGSRQCRATWCRPCRCRSKCLKNKSSLLRVCNWFRHGNFQTQDTRH